MTVSPTARPAAGPAEPLTPTIDGLHRTGAELTNYYVYRFCSPTRSSFMVRPQPAPNPLPAVEGRTCVANSSTGRSSVPVCVVLRSPPLFATERAAAIPRQSGEPSAGQPRGRRAARDDNDRRQTQRLGLPLSPDRQGAPTHSPADPPGRPADAPLSFFTYVETPTEG